MMAPAVINKQPPNGTLASYPPHILTQKLNNRGAYYIETGDYHQAIKFLVKALKISERLEATESSTSCCCCHSCSLDACLSSNCCRVEKNNNTSSRTSRSNNNSQSEIFHHGPQETTSTECYQEQVSNPFAICRQEEEASMHSNPDKDPTKTITAGGYVYCKPIYVSVISIHEGHKMGVTLSLIVVFNLALAHHLAGLRGRSADYLRYLGKAAQLYELAYQLQLDEQHEDRLSSLRFTMIIANNLGEIYRIVNDHSKHIMCLQHLLSTMMYLIDCRFPPDYIEMDGFWRNASPLILQQKCASAA